MGPYLEEAGKLEMRSAQWKRGANRLPSTVQAGAALRSCARSLRGSLLGLHILLPFPGL